MTEPGIGITPLSSPPLSPPTVETSVTDKVTDGISPDGISPNAGEAVLTLVGEHAKQPEIRRSVFDPRRCIPIHTQGVSGTGPRKAWFCRRTSLSFRRACLSKRCYQVPGALRIKMTASLARLVGCGLL